MPLSAEPASPRDLPDAFALIARSQLPEHGVAELWGHYFVVREDDGRVVGVAGLELHGSDGLLRSVAVDPDYRGQGIGDRLVAAAMERARLLPLRTVYLLTTSAREYFARRGFTACSREDAPAAVRESWEFRSGCPATAVLMMRPAS
jgi:amino-acid N-acetyltransferase